MRKVRIRNEVGENAGMKRGRREGIWKHSFAVESRFAFHQKLDHITLNLESDLLVDCTSWSSLYNLRIVKGELGKTTQEDIYSLEEDVPRDPRQLRVA